MITRYLGVVLVRSPVALSPIVKGAAMQFGPSENILQCHFRLLEPSSNRIHNSSRILWGAQRCFRVPQALFLLNVLFKKLCHDVVLLLALRFELLDPFVFRSFLSSHVMVVGKEFEDDRTLLQM